MAYRNLPGVAITTSGFADIKLDNDFGVSTTFSVEISKHRNMPGELQALRRTPIILTKIVPLTNLLPQAARTSDQCLSQAL